MKPISRFIPSLATAAVILIAVAWFACSILYAVNAWVFCINLAIIFYCTLRHEYPRVMRFFGMGIVHCLNLAIVILGGWRPLWCNRRLHWTKQIQFKDETTYDYLRPTWDAAAEQENLWKTGK